MDKINIKNISKKHIIISIILAVVLLVCVLSLAWFTSGSQLHTYVRVKEPFSLAIKGANQSAIEAIDLSDVDLSSTTREVNFVFCITGTGTDEYDMELAYTTNVPFNYTIYKTEQSTSTNNDGIKEATALVDNITYFYKIDNGEKLEGNYLNKEDTGVANKEYYANAYGEYSYVQKNAKPIYCLFSDLAVRDKIQINDNFADYYILQLTWNEDVAREYSKETDMVYLLAENH